MNFLSLLLDLLTFVPDLAHELEATVGAVQKTPGTADKIAKAAQGAALVADTIAKVAGRPASPPDLKPAA